MHTRLQRLNTVHQQQRLPAHHEERKRNRQALPYPVLHMLHNGFPTYVPLLLKCLLLQDPLHTFNLQWHLERPKVDPEGFLNRVTTLCLLMVANTILCAGGEAVPL